MEFELLKNCLIKDQVAAMNFGKSFTEIKDVEDLQDRLVMVSYDGEYIGESDDLYIEMQLLLPKFDIGELNAKIKEWFID